MKDILDYPNDTPGSAVDIGLLKLHESRGMLVFESFGGVSGFIAHCVEYGNDKATAVFKQRFEEINGIKWPNNIQFDL